jgi:Zn-finger protein
MPTYNLLDFLPMACLLDLVDTFGLNVWLCVACHIIHDTREAGRLLQQSHSV